MVIFALSATARPEFFRRTSITAPELDRIAYLGVDEARRLIVAGQRPFDLTRQEAVAYDFAAALVNGGVLPELTYRAAVDQFGAHGAAELSYLIGLYCMVSVTLNTFDVPVPD